MSIEATPIIEWSPSKGEVVTYPDGVTSTGPQWLTLDAETK